MQSTPVIPHRKAMLLLALALLVSGSGLGQPPAPAMLEPALVAGSEGLPEGWRHVTFPRISEHTRYTVTSEGGQPVLVAEADGSASLLVWEQEFDPRDYPRLEWAWRIAGGLAGADVAHKQTDDAPARVMVLFPDALAGTRGEASWARRLYRAIYGDALPTHGLAYIAAPVATAKAATASSTAAWRSSAYTRHMKLLVLAANRKPVQAGGKQDEPGWQHFQRDLVADYRAAFGRAIPSRALLAVMVDTDNTHQRTVTAFRGLRMLRR